MGAVSPIGNRTPLVCVCSKKLCVSVNGVHKNYTQKQIRKLPFHTYSLSCSPGALCGRVLRIAREIKLLEGGIKK